MACTGKQYGGFQQTLFLGCSVVSFSANAGWNEQVSEVTIELVYDDCAPAAGDSKRYWDLTLTEQAWTQADPGFLGDPDYGNIDIVGMPAYFRFGDFEFTGLIQSWQKTNSTSGNRYIVKLLAPVSILENSRLIIGEYAGSLIPPSPYILPPSFTPHNVFNIFGYSEAQGLLCPQYSQTSPGFYTLGDAGIDGATFGTPAGGFGGSLANANGMQWNVIKNIFNVLVNATPIIGNTSDFSPNGRVTGKSNDISSFGAPWNNGFGILTYDRTINLSPTADYFVDISELPLVPDYFRFNQSEITILDAISRVCQEAGHDFYIELLPVKSGNSSSGIVKFIKVRTVSRINAPAFGQLDTFADNAQSSGILKGSSIGREFRNEINSKFVIGGLKQTLYQAYDSTDPEGDGDPTNPQADDMILPFFGTDSQGNMIVPTLDASGDWEFSIETDNIEQSLTYASFTGAPITINERELRASASPEMWATYIVEANTDTNKALNGMTGILNFPSFEQLYHQQIKWRTEAFQNNGIIIPGSGRFFGLGRDFNALSSRAIALTDPILVGIQEDTQKVYGWISSIAQEYYGTKFAVRVPYSCFYVDPESNQILLSEEPTSDGGWTEQTNVLGLGLNSDELTFFRNDTNKIETIIAFTGFSSLDASNLDIENHVVSNNNLYLRGIVDSEYVYHDITGATVPRAIVEISSPIATGTKSDEAIIHGLIQLSNMLPAGKLSFEGIRQAYQNVGNKGIASYVLDKAIVPNAVAFGMRSNINTYGPWVSLGKVGGIQVDKNDGLVPWEYGGYSNLNAAGIALANTDVTNMQVGEMGTITLATCPEIPLGAELNSLTLLAGKQLVENRSGVTGTYSGVFASGTSFNQDYFQFNYGFSQSGLYGPTISDIGLTVDEQGVSTQYQFRTYTPRHGTFARVNAERLKEINQNRMRYVRDLRNYVRSTSQEKTNNSISAKQSLRSEIRKLRKPINQIDRALQPRTPHELFVGQVVDWGNAKRTVITTTSFNELPNEFDSGTYDNKSISTLESIIRPVSLYGSASGLARLIKPILPETGTVTGDGPENISLSQIDFMPYANPLSVNSSGILDRRYNHTIFGSDLGHDFDLVSRANLDGNSFTKGVPTGGLLMHRNDGSYDYQYDYRTFALRGPLLLHSWGYDSSNNPIPNYADNEDAITSGIYESTGLSGTFMSGWLTRPDTWPVAPVDLRLNRQRGVWEAGGLCTIVSCEATTSSSSTAQNFSGNNVVFFQGSDPTVTGTDSLIDIENFFGWSVVPTLRVMAMKAADSNQYVAYQLQCN